MRPVCEGDYRRPDRTTTSDGESVAASERTALVSAPYDDDDREGGSESVYAFGAPAPTSPGDVNGDIDFFDIDRFCWRYSTGPATGRRTLTVTWAVVMSSGDINGDGAVDFFDIEPCAPPHRWRMSIRDAHPAHRRKK